MKSFKKRWNEELDTLVPNMSDQVRQAEIATVSQTTQLNSIAQPSGLKAKTVQPKRRFFVSIASVLAVALIAVFVIPALVNLTFTNTSPTAVVVEINPSIVFSVDEKGVVIKVVANNADADVLLYGGADKQMIGKSVEDATNIFVDLAREMGYFNSDNNDVNVFVDEEHSKLVKSITKSVQNYFASNSVQGVVNTNSLKLDELCQKMHLQVTDSLEQLTQNLLDAQTKFYVRMSADEQFSFEEAYSQNITIQSIVDMVKSTLDKQWQFVQQQYEDICQIQHLATKWITSLFDSKEMQELQQALDNYEQKYGVKLTLENIGDEIVEQISNVSAMVTTLFSTLTVITVEYFEQHAQEFADFMRKMNVAYVDKIFSLLESPQTVEDYLSKMEDYCATSYQIKLGSAFGN